MARGRWFGASAPAATTGAGIHVNAPPTPARNKAAARSSLRAQRGEAQPGDGHDHAEAHDGQQPESASDRGDGERADQVCSDVRRSERAGHGVGQPKIVADGGKKHTVGESSERLSDGSDRTDEEDSGQPRKPNRSGRRVVQ